MIQKNASKEPIDVLVVGSGIAGVMAALSAAERGGVNGGASHVALVSSGKLFSGSSFSSDTWGLGLIAPATVQPSEVKDLVDEICKVGCGVANRSLVESFVGGIHPALQKLESLGVSLLEPEHADEREFIPCFDSKHRLWRGFESREFEEALRPYLLALGIEIYEHWELVDLLEGPPSRETGTEMANRYESVNYGKETPQGIRDDSSCSSRSTVVTGAVFFDHSHQEFIALQARSVVLATGGFASLFERGLGASDNLGTAQAIAYRHGAELVNIEFMQIMPTMTGPGEGRVFNEKMFRFAALDPTQCASLDMAEEQIASQVLEGVSAVKSNYGNLTSLSNSQEQQEGISTCISSEITNSDDCIDPLMYLSGLLDQRAGYGPFTSRLPSRGIDLAMATVGDGGLEIRFNLPDGALPEFASHYFVWLESQTGLTAKDSVRIVPYAHAANGGILIDAQGRTCVPGLFAAGEVTGGMHGADRIGGLASANALVFGLRAGEAAMDFAKNQDLVSPVPQTWVPNGVSANQISVDGKTQGSSSTDVEFGIAESEYRRLFRQLQEIMTDHCMIMRSEDGLTQAIKALDILKHQCQDRALLHASPYEQLLHRRLQDQLLFARLFATCALKRKKSCGSHFRTDEK